MAEKRYILGMELDQLRRDKEKAKSLFSDLGRDVERSGKQIDNTFARIGKTVAGAFSIAAATSFVRQLIEVTGQFQTFQAVLTNTLGDAGKAKSAMEMIQDFAATTPFQVDALTGSFVKLANQGFIPTYKQMTMLGDLASSTGKGFDQLTEAIIDAQTGEFERLKEFGIRASKEGDNVTFTFKEQKTQVDFAASSIRDYILSLGELEGVQGANAAIAATLTGKVSNLQDGITQMINEIGQSSSGVLSDSISGVSYLVEHYETVGKVLGTLIVTYGSYKAAVLLSVAANKVAALGQSVKLYISLAKEIKSAKDAQIAFNLATKANPYVLLASAVMTVVGAFAIWGDKTKDAIKLQSALKKTLDDVETQVVAEKARVEDLQRAVSDSNTAEDIRIAKLRELKRIIPGYNAEISNEGTLINNNTQAIKDYLVEYEKQIKLKALEEALIDAEKRKFNSNRAMKIHGSHAQALRNQWEDQTWIEKQAPWDKEYKNMSNAYDAWNGAIGEYNQALKDIEDLNAEIDNIRKGDGINGGKTTPAVKNESYWKKQLDDAQDSLKALEITKANANEISRLKGVITNAQNKIAEYSVTKKTNNSSDTDDTKQKSKIAEDSLKLQKDAHRAEMELKRSQTSDKIELIKLDTQEQLDAIESQRVAFIAKYKGQEDSQEYKSGIAALNKLSAVAYNQGQEQIQLEEQRQYEERLENFKTFQKQYQELEEEHKSNLEIIATKGGTQADIDVEDKSYEEDLQTLNDEVLATIGEFESLGIEATDRVIDQMIARLQKAKGELEGDTSGADNTTKIKAVNAEIERCIKLKEENDKPSKGRSLKEWQDMENQLKDCISSFNEIGDAVGGVAGEVISSAGDIAGSTLSAISGIQTLVKSSSEGMEAAGKAGAESMSAVEKASVILAVIGAVIQLATKIASLFKAAKGAEEASEKAQAEATQRSIDGQLKYNALLREEISLLKERNTIFGDDPYSAAIAGTERYSGAMQDLKTELKGEITDEERNAAKFIDHLTDGEANATQALLKSYQSGIKGLSDIKIATDSHTENTGFLNLGRKQVDDYSSITSVYSDLIDQYGNLNTERAQIIVDTQKMSDEDKKRLENMIALQEEADEAIQSINDYYSSIFGDMGSSLKDALIDAFRNGTDAGKDFCKNMVSMLEQLGADFAFSMSIGQVLADQQAKVDEINRDSTLTDQERADKLMALAIETGEKAAAQQDDFNAFLEAYQQGAANEGYKLWETDTNRTSTASGIATASQESVDENNGRLTAIQGHTFSIAESVLRLREIAERGAGLPLSVGVTDKMAPTTLSTIGEDIKYLRNNAGQILTTVMGIKGDTAHLSRLQKIETDMGSVKTCLKNMEIKGLKIKR